MTHAGSGEEMVEVGLRRLHDPGEMLINFGSNCRGFRVEAKDRLDKGVVAELTKIDRPLCKLKIVENLAIFVRPPHHERWRTRGKPRDHAVKA